MAAVITHYCRACSYNTPVLFSASVFSQNHTCNHPGTSTSKKAEMQQDELAALFQQSLSFQTPTPVEPVPEPQSEQPQHQHQHQQEQNQDIELESHQEQQPPQQEEQQQHRQPIVYASTHYTPNTTHLLSRTHSAPNLNSPAAIPTTNLLPSSRTNPALLAIFSRHSIDIDDLSPGQLELFTGADADQQLRLLELWRITLRGAAAEDGVWTSATSLEMEEQLARERWERMQSHHHHRAPAQLSTTDMEMMTDDEGTTTASSPTSVASPSMRGMASATAATAHQQLAEPYMLSGYEQLAGRDYAEQAAKAQGSAYQAATDPVYKAAVENQYGAFQAMREYGYESTGGAGGWYGGGDEEMVM
ncbi:uncharacterized protein LTHEOB_2780 [Neofusicoccum parvum]|uniref:Uncharacterized protein LTHEOB_2780 n=1 Tax=Neofusicoccum parvum TaxID=310453 RepID=A0ACB5SK27_9PEZI|nr:uncharacterized protein LTHEOB_2780 [Neofusicoccum parvum]GME62784.1 uncharacterized protein LTHEOB_2780 [Neofusicoccum parvum]